MKAVIVNATDETALANAADSSVSRPMLAGLLSGGRFYCSSGAAYDIPRLVTASSCDDAFTVLGDYDAAHFAPIVTIASHDSILAAAGAIEGSICESLNDTQIESANVVITDAKLYGTVVGFVTAVRLLLADDDARNMWSAAITRPNRQEDVGLQSVAQSENFKIILISTLLDEAIEDGVGHPAESVIREGLATNRLANWDVLTEILTTNYDSRPSLCASLIRCFGRLERKLVGKWGLIEVERALLHSDAEVRDAAIRALEEWGGEESRRILCDHNDCESWLDEFARQVVRDLSNDRK